MSINVSNYNDTSLITLEEVFGVVYDELNDLVHYLAIRYSQGATEILMGKDEIVGELYEELWKGCAYYHKRNLPIQQMLAVLKVMLSNRVAELRYKYYSTHRKISQLNISIDVTVNDDVSAYDMYENMDSYDPLQDLISTDVNDPAAIYDSLELVNSVRLQLNSIAKQVFDAVIYGHEQLTLHVWLSSVRSKSVYKSNRPIKIKPYHIASALCLTEPEVKVAMKSINSVMNEVCNEC